MKPISNAAAIELSERLRINANEMARWRSSLEFDRPQTYTERDLAKRYRHLDIKHVRALIEQHCTVLPGGGVSIEDVRALDAIVKGWRE